MPYDETSSFIDKEFEISNPDLIKDIERIIKIGGFCKQFIYSINLIISVGILRFRIDIRC